MPAHAPNGRIKLSWQQVTWGISVIVLLLASWYDSRTQTALAITKLDGRVASIEKIISTPTYSKTEIDLMLLRANEAHADLHSRIMALEQRINGRNR